MRILSFGDKLKKPGQEPLVTVERNSTADVSFPGKDVEVGIRTTSFRVTAVRKMQPCVSICLPFVGLIVMSIGVIGGLYCFRAWGHKPAFLSFQRLRSISTSVSGADSETGEFFTLDGVPLSHQKFTVDTHHGLITEEILTQPKYERLEVPSFNGSNRGVFVHDFETNLTAIVDTHNCYVMPLNRKRVMPPASLADFLVKNNQGYYDVDTEVIRETMRVVLPAIMSSVDYGIPILRECYGKKVYQLEKDTSRVQKRNAESPAIFRTYTGKPLEIAITNYQEKYGG